MKRLMNLYDNLSVGLRITYLGFALLAFGYFIQNPNVNIFYTFKSTIVLLFAEGAYRLGKAIILNIPLILMICFVCKKANSGMPIVLSIVGLFTYNTTISLFASQTLPSQCYNFTYGALFDFGTGTLPFETGIIGSLLIAYVTRYAFIHSRYRSNYSLLGFLDKNSASLLYEIFYCVILGMLVAYGYPYFYAMVQSFAKFISGNLSGLDNLFMYGFLDRTFSIAGIGQIIRQPFWYTSAGGTLSSNLTGQVVYGDVNIWEFIQDTTSNYSGCGRFITPYYIINMFMVPAIYLGQFVTVSEKKDRATHLIPLLGICGLSILAGNPLPLELMLLFTAPLLLVIYLLAVSSLFPILSYSGIFLGFVPMESNIVTAMPGSFPDYIINLRNAALSSTISKIFVVGIIAAIVMFVLTIVYYRFLSYDAVGTGELDRFVDNVIVAVGGVGNINNSTNSILKLYLDLKDLDLISVPKVQDLGAKRAYETKDGICIELGTGSCLIAARIRKAIKKHS